MTCQKEQVTRRWIIVCTFYVANAKALALPQLSDVQVWSKEWNL